MESGSAPEVAPPARVRSRSRSRTIIVLVIVVLLALTAVYGYYAVTKKSGPSHSIEIISGVISAPGSSNGTGISSALFWVENTGSLPITNLTGTVPGLKDIRFAVNGGAPITDQNVLFPNQIALNLTVLPPGDVTFTNGSSYPLTVSATFSNNSTATVNSTVLAQFPIPPSCYTNSSYAVNFQTVSYSVNGATNLATWVLGINSTSPYPVNAVVVGVNNGTLWIPIVLNGRNISPTNQLHSGIELTSTLTWSNIPGTDRYFEWVGSCANQNGITRVQTTG